MGIKKKEWSYRDDESGPYAVNRGEKITKEPNYRLLE